MASLVNLPGVQGLLKADNWETSGYRARLLMTNTTADTENNASFLSSYSTQDKFNGSGATDNLALTNKLALIDAPNNRNYLDADDTAFGAIGNGTRAIQGVLIFKFVTNDADSVPLVFVQFSSSINPAGGQLTIQWDAGGILQFQ